MNDRTNAPPKPWVRTSKAKPCPICCGVDCLLSGPTDPAAE